MLEFENFVTSPVEAREGCHAILYGPPKCGKTSTFDDPVFKVLHIDLEGSSAVLYGAPNVRRIDVPTIAAQTGLLQFEVLVDLVKAIEQGKLRGYDLYALDSITQFEAITKEYIAQKYAPHRAREIKGKFGAQSDWGDLKDLITQFVKRVHSLTKRGKDSVHWIWTAHVNEVTDSITQQLVSTKIQLQGKNTAEVVMSIVDAIFYMYNKPIVIEEEGSKKRYEIERGILTRQVGPYVAGVRQSKRAEPLPAKIIDPVWSDIFEKLGYVRKDTLDNPV